MIEKQNIKRQSILIQIVSAITAIIMFMVTNLVNVYADGSVSGNVGGGGSGSMSQTNDYKAWDSGQQGYRFYIINSNLERVSPIYDYCFTTPTDVGEIIKTTRFDVSSSPGQLFYTNIQSLATLTNSKVSDIPRPVKNNQGHGEEFREWFLRNIVASSGGVGIILDGPKSNSSSSDSSSINNSDSDNLVYNEDSSNILSEASGAIIDSAQKLNTESNSGKQMTQSEINQCALGASIISDPQNIYNNLSPDEKYSATALYRESIIVQYKALYGYAKNTLDMSDDNARYYATCVIYRQLIEYINKSEVWLTESIRRGITTNVAKYVARKICLSTVLLDQTYSENPYYMDSSLLKQLIPLSGDTESGPTGSTSIDSCPALIILNEKGILKVSGYENALEAILLDDHYLIVEPITWLYIPTNGTNYESYKTYGSYYNLVEKWVSVGGKDTGAFYASYMTSLGNNCMLLEGSITTEQNKTIYQVTATSQMTISQIYTQMKYNNAGYGMHIYSGINLEQPDTLQSTGGTETSDTPLITDTEWLLTESQLTKVVNTSNTKLSTHDFTVTLPELTTTHTNCYLTYCSGCQVNKSKLTCTLLLFH